MVCKTCNGKGKIKHTDYAPTGSTCGDSTRLVKCLKCNGTGEIKLNTIELKFDNIKDMEERSYKLADMLCFLKGYRACLNDNEEYSNQLEYVFDNLEFMREINIKIKEKLLEYNKESK